MSQHNRDASAVHANLGLSGGVCLPLEQVLTPSRSAGLERLFDFVPRSGTQYARSRNTDFGPDNRRNVSQLSPYTRHRLVTEHEIVAATLERFAPSTAEKFIQEICWRTYWKGWLEMRPAVWDAYLEARDRDVYALTRDRALRRNYEAAVEGDTGIAAFDAWVHELADTNYLHNHTRMWFASIWMFTLELPWTLGADLFMRHLLDGDSASNTLSWRWVGGLQTRGKTYLARPSNIYQHTDGRFNPPSQELAPIAEPLVEDLTFVRGPLPILHGVPDKPYLLLIHEDDLTPETLLPTGAASPCAVAVIDPAATYLAAPLSEAMRRDKKEHVAEPVLMFKQAAVRDAAVRVAAHFGCDVHWIGDPATLDDETQQPISDALVSLARNAGAQAVALAVPPVGPTRRTLDPIADRARAAGLSWHHRVPAEACGHCPPVSQPLGSAHSPISRRRARLSHTIAPTRH